MSNSEAPARNRTCIRERIDCALEKMAWGRMEVRAIYLTEKDIKALGRIMAKELGVRKIHPHAYRNHFVRPGKASTIYSTHGVETAVPKSLSHRVAEQVAA